MVQTIINHSPSQIVGGLGAPVACMTGLKADPTVFVVEVTEPATPQYLPWILMKQVVNNDKVLAAVDVIHYKQEDAANG